MPTWEPFQVWLARIVMGLCDDPRPVLLIDMRADRIGCFPISTKCYHGSCFPLDKNDPDFAATGLTRSCFILDTHIFEIAAQDLLKLRGHLTGDLLQRFRDFSGV